MLTSDGSQRPNGHTQSKTACGSSQRQLIAVGCFLIGALTQGVVSATSTHGSIGFDLPSIAIAHPAPSRENASNDPTTECITLAMDVSVFLPGQAADCVDHLIVRCIPRDTRWQVLDYTPKTETTSDFAAPIEHKQLEESTKSGGVSADLSYAQLASGHLGAEQGDKQSATVTFQRHAPVQAHITSGTFQRRSGVYFKLRRSAQHILEGERRFDLVYSIPAGMRGGLIDVQVLAIGLGSSRSPWDGMSLIADKSGRGRHTSLHEDHFVVAVAKADDAEAQRLASQLAATEQHLRERSQQAVTEDLAKPSLSQLYRHVAARLDWRADHDRREDGFQSINESDDWVDRLVHGSADPYTDRAIAKLPVDVRVEALRYCDLRRQLSEIRAPAKEVLALRGEVAPPFDE
ncbi:MAG: hypothetical protein AAGD07_15790 [Planctomycetota bacterium]